MKAARMSRVVTPVLLALVVASLLGMSSLANAREDKKQNEKPSAPPPRQGTRAEKPSAPAARPSAPSQRPSAPAQFSRPGERPGTPENNRPQVGNPARPGGAANQPFNRGGASAGYNRNASIRTPPARGSSERTFKNGNAIRYRPNGKVSDFHDVKRGVDIHQGLNGSRVVIANRPDHSRVVYERGRPGYVGRPYSFHGQDFVRRTYVYGGHTYSHFYHDYRFRGLDIQVYAPERYWGRSFYGWAYNPWVRPVRYGWGWMGSPWYGYYGFYFSPYAAYPSAAFWLTDYMLSQDLAEAYDAQQEAGEVDGDPSMGVTPVSPEVKQMIADEVRNQLALENQEAQQNAMGQDIDPGSSGLGRILSDVANGRPHTFVVGAPLDVVDASGVECTLSDGDVLSLQQAPPPDATAADLVVMASKGGQECPGNDVVSVQLGDLQEMQNDMRESIDQGLQELNQNQGQGGLPPAPPSAAAPAGYAAIAPPPDPNAASELQQEAQQGDQAQNDMNAAGPQGAGVAASPPPIQVGQTVEEVESILGPPTGRAMIGNQLIYNYNNHNGMQIMFVNGRVTEVR